MQDFGINAADRTNCAYLNALVAGNDGITLLHRIQTRRGAAQNAGRAAAVRTTMAGLIPMTIAAFHSSITQQSAVCARFTFEWTRVRMTQQASAGSSCSAGELSRRQAPTKYMHGLVQAN
jgi:hypothetical protein